MKPYCIPLATLLLTILTGCISAPSPTELGQMDLGQPPTKEQYEPAIKAELDNMLLDPYSAHIEYLTTRPERVWVREPPRIFNMGEVYCGYLVEVAVNAKNRMGGYTGKKLYKFLFDHGRIVRVITPE
jgi:hypothetical protein